MVKKVVIAVIAAVVVLVGFGIQQATASESLPEGSLMRQIDVKNCADSGVERGDHGHCVWILQTALNREGYKLDTDGSFGPKTANMVLGFNRAWGLNQNSKGEPQATPNCETFMTLAEKLQPSAQQKKGTKYYAAWVAGLVDDNN